MTMHDDTLLMFVADALCMPLNLDSHGKYRAGMMRNLKLGQWGHMETEVSVCSDVITSDHAAFFVRITSGLWLYIVSRSDNMTATIFNGGKLHWRVKDLDILCGKSVEDTWNTIKGVAGDKFLFETSTHAWRKVNADNLDQDLTSQNPNGTGTHTEKQ